MTKLRALRLTTIIMAVLLALQFELGMAVNLSPALEVVPPVAGTPAAVWSALAKVGADALTHAVLGSLLTVLALANLVLAITSGARSVALIGALAFVCIAMASANGILFTLSGFKDDHYSHGMATTFLLGFALHFIQVGILTVRLRTQVPGRSVEPS
ncbi:MAG: hypothetical protein ACLQCB_17830 [Spirochaetia bacterium]